MASEEVRLADIMADGFYDNQNLKARPQGTRAQSIMVWACGLLLCLGGGSVLLFWVLFADKTHTFNWSRGVQVQITQRVGVDLYIYQISQDGSEIAPPQRYEKPSPISQGPFEGTPYFFLRKLIAIYRPTKSGTFEWRTWDTDDKSLTSWMEKFVANRRSVRKKRKEKEFFEEADYAVVSFKEQGKTWTIGLHDLSSFSAGSDWYGGMPKYLHVESNDRGTTWKVKERLSIPDWLIELPKKHY